MPLDKRIEKADAEGREGRREEQRNIPLHRAADELGVERGMVAPAGLNAVQYPADKQQACQCQRRVIPWRELIKRLCKAYKAALPLRQASIL